MFGPFNRQKGSENFEKVALLFSFSFFRWALEPTCPTFGSIYRASVHLERVAIDRFPAGWSITLAALRKAEQRGSGANESVIARNQLRVRSYASHIGATVLSLCKRPAQLPLKPGLLFQEISISIYPNSSE